MVKISQLYDDVREKVHFELVLCTPEEFIARYLELDPDFSIVLWTEFSIISDDIYENVAS